MIENTMLAYFAGLIDGEGCVNTYMIKNGRGVAYPTPTIVFVQAEGNKGKETAELMRSLFGGVVTHRQPKNPKHQVVWRAEVRGSSAVNMARQIAPFSVVKREALEKIIK